MKKVSEIPECSALIEQMFKEWEELDKIKGQPDYEGHQEVEKRTLPKVTEAYNRYKKEHPEEFENKETK